MKRKKRKPNSSKNTNRKFDKFTFNSFSEIIINLRHRFWSKIGKIKYLFLVYFLITLIGSLLLYWRVSQKDGANVSYVDALFTAASAFSDTGLVTKTTATTWSMFGQIVIACLILIGGIGFFALRVYVLNYIFGSKLSLFKRDVLGLERSSNKIGEIREVILVSITTMFVLLLISTFGLFFYFYFIPGNFVLEGKNGNNPLGDVNMSLRFAFFHSITSLNNAGFDIIGGHSLAPYYHNYGLQIWLIILFVIGGIGYPVVYDVYKYFKSLIKKEEKRHKFSLFTKVSLITYCFVTLFGLALVLGFEIGNKSNNHFWNLKEASSAIHWGDGTNAYSYGTRGDKVMALIFSVFTTRSAGFATIDFYDVTDMTLGILSVLMFIGAAPSSTGGGIRTTTLAIILLTIISRMRGKNSTHAFKRKINQETVNQASIVFSISIIMIFISFFIIYTSFTSYNTGNLIWDGSISTSDIEAVKHGERTYGLANILFEITSAFGTTGISTGITSSLNTASKLTLILIMFIGQLGISSTVLVWGNSNNKFRRFEYIEDDIIIG